MDALRSTQPLARVFTPEPPAPVARAETPDAPAWQGDLTRYQRLHQLTSSIARGGNSAATFPLTRPQAEFERTVLRSFFGEDARLVERGPRTGIDAGDWVQYRDRDGAVRYRQLGPQEAMDLRYRTQVVRAAHEAGEGWQFHPSQTPQLLDDSGRPVQENAYWKLQSYTHPDGRTVEYLQVRPGVSASQAVEDLYRNMHRYGFDCATAARAISLKATLATLGKSDFDRVHGGLILYGHYDSTDGNSDGGPWRISRGPGVDHGQGPELGPFDPARDRLLAGELRYFETPGDTTTANQGWNVLYLGQGPNGEDLFWRQGGVFSGGIEDEYLSNLRGVPDLYFLLGHDWQPGAAA